MIARRYALLLCALLGALVAMRGHAQDQHIDCSVAIAPVIEFGQPVANPTAQTDSTTAVTVTCNGNGSVKNTAIKVCLLATPNPQRVLRNGASALHYGLSQDSGHGLPLGDTVPYLAMQVVLGNPPQVTAQAAFTLYGRIDAGQMGLAGGLHADSVALQARVSTQLGADCSALPVKATATLLARAQLAHGSCSIVAGDLSFGMAHSLGGGVDGSAALGVTCTEGTPYAVALSGGTGTSDVGHRRMGRNGVHGADDVAYQLYSDSGHARIWGDGVGQTVTGVGTGTPVTHPVFGRVASQATPLPGAYHDTVTATVSY
ncbi:MAG: Csu type fimbrial protein [Lysobacter sp.]